ncbi:MAG: hypothetical protein VX642_05885 [Bdellovibrionota bacterium]|nr:hypothetical protein [Bdellovibrionota bacterium]
MRILLSNLVIALISYPALAADSKLACVCSEYKITEDNITEVKRIYGLADEKAPINKAYEKCVSYQSALTFQCDTKILSGNLIKKTPKTDGFAKSNKSFKF